ncbi:MAG TPA: glycosyltransferase [Rubrobacter sp.]|nr:glycosyltransferase [Rubrobacter sp.]
MEAQGRTATGGMGREGTGRVLLTVVVPTRNEAENVAGLVRGLREGLAGVEFRVVFVDDSTDGTPGVIRGLAEEDGRVTLVHREGADREGGLSTAVTTGIELFSPESEFTCVMDADGQHPPEKVREMLEVARAGDADVVVASRYARGGSYEGLSGWTRRAVSLGSKGLARVVFKEARKTSDPLTGFFLVRNEAISGIQFRPTGFKVLLEILVCAPELRVAEVPFGFRARTAGVSKASLRQGLEYLTHILSLFWFVPSAGRFWKFAMVGASGVVVNSLVLITLAEVFDAHKVIAWMFAVGLSILSNFLLNNAFTWRDVRHSSRIHFLLRGALAYPVAVMGIGANFAVFYPLLKYVSAEFPFYVIFNFLGILAATAVNFALSSRLVFKPSLPANLDPDAPPKSIAEQVRRELKADRVLLVTIPDLVPLGGDPGDLAAAERGVIRLVTETAQPTLTVTGPRRLPQARTNARWANSLAVPILQGGHPVGVVYATRRSTEPFTEEDLHWLTAYTSTAAPIFG